MKIKAFIVEFQEAFDFVQTYRTLLRNNRFVLRTRVPLELAERVKVRFNTPDGNGVTIRCKIATQIDEQAWGITLPKSEDTVWLQEKAVDTEKRLGPAAQRLPKAAADDDWKSTRSGTESKPSSKKATEQGRAASTKIPHGQESLGITRVVRHKSDIGDALPGVLPSEPSGDAGIDFPHGVRRPSPKQSAAFGA